MEENEVDVSVILNSMGLDGDDEDLKDRFFTLTENQQYLLYYRFVVKVQFKEIAQHYKVSRQRIYYIYTKALTVMGMANPDRKKIRRGTRKVQFRKSEIQPEVARKILASVGLDYDNRITKKRWKRLPVLWQKVMMLREMEYLTFSRIGKRMEFTTNRAQNVYHKALDRLNGREFPKFYRKRK